MSTSDPNAQAAQALTPNGAIQGAGPADAQGDAPYFTSSDGTEFKTEADFLAFARSSLGGTALSPDQAKVAGEEKPKVEGQEDPTKDPLKTATEEPKKDVQEDKPAPLTDEQIIAELNKQPEGSIYRDPNYQPFAVEFEKTGDLSPESLKAAAEKFTNGNVALVQAFIEQSKAARAGAQAVTSQTQAQAEAVQADIMSVVGGKESFEALNKWASEGGLTEAQLDAFNKAPVEAQKELLKGYHEKFKASGDAPGPRDVAREGARAGSETSNVVAYASKAEFDSAMRDAKYGKDPAYRAQVEQRLRAARTAGAEWAQ